MFCFYESASGWQPTFRTWLWKDTWGKIVNTDWIWSWRSVTEVRYIYFAVTNPGLTKEGEESNPKVELPTYHLTFLHRNLMKIKRNCIAIPLPRRHLDPPMLWEFLPVGLSYESLVWRKVWRSNEKFGVGILFQIVFFFIFSPKCNVFEVWFDICERPVNRKATGHETLVYNLNVWFWDFYSIWSQWSCWKVNYFEWKVSTTNCAMVLSAFKIPQIYRIYRKIKLWKWVAIVPCIKHKHVLFHHK